jgi:hypothetical protein
MHFYLLIYLNIINEVSSDLDFAQHKIIHYEPRVWKREPQQ